MPNQYIVRKVPVTLEVRGVRNRTHTGPSMIPGAKWEIVEYSTGKIVGDSFADQQAAETACLKLNTCSME